MNEFHEVDRPTTENRPDRSENNNRVLNQAVAATAISGRAITIALNGQSPTTLRNRLYPYMRTRGLVLRARVNKDTDEFIAWAEKKPRAGAESE